jgi:hypothetical protein
MDDVTLTDRETRLIIWGLFELCVARWFEDRELVDEVGNLLEKIGFNADDVLFGRDPNVVEAAADFERRTSPDAFELTDEERDLLRAGLGQWGGPAPFTPAVAGALGFATASELDAECSRLWRRLRNREPLSAAELTWALLATEIVFVSEVVGCAAEWTIVTPYQDIETLQRLRMLQRRMVPVLQIYRSESFDWAESQEQGVTPQRDTPPS